MITYDIARTDADLRAIRELQGANLSEHLSESEWRKQGYVTVRHDLSILREMNTPWPHIVARDQGTVVGYALVMLPSFSRRLPILIPMFERIAQLTYAGNPISEKAWFVMGQVCIHKEYRGQGIFGALFSEMRTRMKPRFDYVLTQISVRNPRSLRAHRKAGFETIHSYRDEAAGENWKIVLWDWTENMLL